MTLAERHGGVTVSRESFEAMIAEVAVHVDRFASEHGGTEGLHMLGTSGTVTTIAGVYLDLPRYERRRVDGCWMNDTQVTDVVERLLAMSYEDRVANPCIGAERADLVLAGCAILEAIRRAFPCDAAARRRPGPARRHAGADDARGRRLGRRQGGRIVTTKQSERRGERELEGPGQGQAQVAVLQAAGSSASSTILMWRAPSARAFVRARRSS